MNKLFQEFSLLFSNFKINTTQAEQLRLSKEILVNEDDARTKINRMMNDTIIDSKLTIEPRLFEMHKKCLNNKADLIQQSLNEFAIYTKDFQEKNKQATPVTFVLNENTRDKIKNIIKNFKTITETEFDCLYVNKDAPLNVCNQMDRFAYEKISEALNQLMLAEKFIILYHNEIMDLKTIVLPKIIHFITVCDKIKKEDKINLLNLLKSNVPKPSNSIKYFPPESPILKAIFSANK
jgi:hypothetical protein